MFSNKLSFKKFNLVALQILIILLLLLPSVSARAADSTQCGTIRGTFSCGSNFVCGTAPNLDCSVKVTCPDTGKTVINCSTCPHTCVCPSGQIDCAGTCTPSDGTCDVQNRITNNVCTTPDTCGSCKSNYTEINGQCITVKQAYLDMQNTGLLSITGDLKSDSNLLLADGMAINIQKSGGASVLNIGNWITGDTTTNGADVNIWGNLNIGDAGFARNFKVSGNAEIGGQIKITGGVLGAGKVLTSVDASGLASWQTPANGLPSGTVNQTLRYDGTNWTASSGLIVDSSGKVGIGIQIPGSLLSVNSIVAGETPFLSFTKNNNQNRLKISSTDSPEVVTRIDTDNAQSSLVLGVGWGDSLVIAPGGKIGINTGSPAEALEVNSSYPSDTNTTRLRVTDTEANQNPEFQLQYGTMGDEHWGIYVDKIDVNKLKFWNNNNNAVTFTSAGDVIATGILQTPQIKITNGAGAGKVLTSVDDTGLASWQTPAAGGLAGTGTANYVPKFLTGTSVGDSSVFIDTAGNVGIGTTTAPGAKLDVNGTIGAVGQLVMTQSVGEPRTVAFSATNPNSEYNTVVGGVYTVPVAKIGLSWYGNYWWLNAFRSGDSSMGDFSISYGTTDYMRITSGGNVGIGTTSPSLGKLQVVGNATTPAIFAQLSPNANQIILQTGSNLAGTYGWKLMQDEATTGDLFLKKRLNGTDSDVMYFQRSSGNVGIGTPTPNQNFVINRAVANSNWDALAISNTGSWALGKHANIIFTDNTATGSTVAAMGATVNNEYVGRIDFHSFYGGGSGGYGNDSNIVMSVVGNGKVGIGTTTPSTKLEVRDDTSGIAQMRITDYAQNPEIQLQYNSGNHHWGIYADQADRKLRFWNNDGNAVGGQAVTFTPNGDVIVSDSLQASRVCISGQCRSLWPDWVQYTVGIATGSRVGIGSMSVQGLQETTAKLYVNGDIYATGSITCGGTCGTGSSGGGGGGGLLSIIAGDGLAALGGSKIIDAAHAEVHIANPVKNCAPDAISGFDLTKGDGVNGNIVCTPVGTGTGGGNITTTFGQIAFGTVANAVGGSDGLTWNNTEKLLIANKIKLGQTDEGDIEDINKIIGFNDLIIKSNPDETKSIYYGALNHHFFTTTNGTSTERLTISNNGFVGIGVDTPAVSLDVGDGAIRARSVCFKGAGNWNDCASSWGSAGSGTWWKNGTDTQILDVYTNSGGYVGIGTPTPSAMLDIYGGVLRVGGASTSMALSGSGLEFTYSETSGGLITSYNHNTPAYTDILLNGNNITFKTNNTERMYINDTGLVGIGGTPDADGELFVKGTGRYGIKTESTSSTRAGIFATNSSPTPPGPGPALEIGGGWIKMPSETITVIGISSVPAINNQQQITIDKPSGIVIFSQTITPNLLDGPTQVQIFNNLVKYNSIIIATVQNDSEYEESTTVVTVDGITNGSFWLKVSNNYNNWDSMTSKVGFIVINQ